MDNSSSTQSSSQQQIVLRSHPELVDPSVYAYCEDVSKYEKLSKIGQGRFSLIQTILINMSSFCEI